MLVPRTVSSHSEGRDLVVRQTIRGAVVVVRRGRTTQVQRRNGFALTAKQRRRGARWSNRPLMRTCPTTLPGASFREWAERWYDSKPATRKPSTVRAYRSVLDSSVLPAFGARRIRTITAADIVEWVTALSARGLTPPTIKHHYGALAAVLAFAARNRAITYNPARDVDLPTDKSIGRRRPEPHFLTGSEVEQLARVSRRGCPALRTAHSVRGVYGVRGGSWPGSALATWTCYAGRS